MSIEQYANGASTTITEDLDASENGVDVTSATGFPTAGNFRVLVDSEIMIATGVSGSTFAVVRGAEGTTAATHTNGATITHIVTKDSTRALFSQLYGCGWRQPILGSDWTWVNQGTATSSEGGGALSIYAPAVSGNNMRILKRSAPGTPYTISAVLRQMSWKVNYPFAGIGWRQSSDGKLVLFGLTSANGITLQKYTSATAYSATYTLSPAVSGDAMWGNAFGAPMVLRINDTGTNRVCSIGYNGMDWLQVHTVGRTDFMTPDEVLFFCESNNSTYPTGVTLYAWEQE